MWKQELLLVGTEVKQRLEAPWEGVEQLTRRPTSAARRLQLQRRNQKPLWKLLPMVMVDGGSEEEVGREEDGGHGDRHLLMG